MLRDVTGSSQPAVQAILATVWSNRGAQLRVLTEDEASSTLISPIGLHLNYRIAETPVRWCVGHHSQSVGYVDCTSRPEERSRTCTSCSVAEAIFASQLHHAHTEPSRVTDSAMAEHLQQPNLLYLAAFRDGSVKIGTSTSVRVEKRLLEQGAWQARIVAEAADGYSVRIAEDLVTTSLHIPQSVSASRKLTGLGQPLPDDEIANRLDPLAFEVNNLLSHHNDSRVVSNSTDWRNPAADEPVWAEVRPYPLNPRVGAHDLEVVAIVGRMVAARRTGTNDVFAIDLQRLYGLELNLGDHEADKLIIQDSLF